MRPWITHLRMGYLRFNSFSANGNIIKTNFLTSFQAAQVKNVISIVLTRSSSVWPVTYFLIDMTNIQTWPTYHQDKHSIKFQHAQIKNAASRVLTRFPFNLA